MDQQIEYKVKNCSLCHSTNKTAKVAPAPLQPVKSPQQLWEKLELNIVEPVERAPTTQRFSSF